MCVERERDKKREREREIGEIDREREGDRFLAES